MKHSPRWLAALALVTLGGVAFADDGGIARVDLQHRLDTALVTGNPSDLGDFSSADVPSIAARLGELAKLGSDEGVLRSFNAVRAASGAKFWGDDFDMLGATLAARPSPMTDDFRFLAESEALLSALGRVDTTVAAQAMIDASGAHRGVLRFDVGRRVRKMGDRALPALIRARNAPSFELRKWAGTELEAMGKRVAGDAVQTKDDDVLIDVLTAFGETHDKDALAVVMAFTTSERKRIRDAARAAMLDYGEDALPKLREVYTNLAARPFDPARSAKDVASDVFALEDTQRSADLDALVDLGKRRLEEGDADGAIEQFEKALAREPALSRKKEMVPAFATRGAALEDSDPEAARAAYREALALDPDTPRKSQIEGALAYLDAKDLAARGIDEHAAYERVLSIDPGNAKARAALDAYAMRREAREAQARRYEYVAVGAFSALALAILLGLRNKKRATR